MSMPSTEMNDDVRWPSYSYNCIRENIHMLMNSNHRIIFLLVTVLYALLTPWLLWRVAGQPTAFVWTISLVACSYFIAGTIYLSDTITTAILSVFFRVSCGTLLTVAATHLIGPTTGAIIFTLFTFYAAGMLGYAIGEHLQRVGFENSAGIAAARPARDEELQKRRDESVFYICFIQGNMTLGLIVRMAWLVFFPVVSEADDLLFIVEELSQEAMFLSWMWTNVVALFQLEEALVSAYTMFGRNQSVISAGGSFSPNGSNKSDQQPSVLLKEALGKEVQHVAGA
nr:unnamed protein product [Digitaria exilis]